MSVAAVASLALMACMATTEKLLRARNHSNVRGGVADAALRSKALH